MLIIIRLLWLPHRKSDVIVHLYTAGKRGKRILLYYLLLGCQKSRITRKSMPQKSTKALNKDRFWQGKCLLVQCRGTEACTPDLDQCVACTEVPSWGQGLRVCYSPAQAPPPPTLPALGQHHPGAASFPMMLCGPMYIWSPEPAPQIPHLLLINLKPSLWFSLPMNGCESPSWWMARKCQLVWGALSTVLRTILAKSWKGLHEISMVLISNSEILWPEFEIRNSWLRSFWPSPFHCS